MVREVLNNIKTTIILYHLVVASEGKSPGKRSQVNYSKFIYIVLQYYLNTSSITCTQARILLLVQRCHGSPCCSKNLKYFNKSLKSWIFPYFCTWSSWAKKKKNWIQAKTWRLASLLVILNEMLKIILLVYKFNCYRFCMSLLNQHFWKACFEIKLFLPSLLRMFVFQLQPRYLFDW